MIANQTVSVPVTSVPTHIVVWQESNSTQVPQSTSSSSELAELRQRVEELEKMVRSLVNHQQPTRVRTVADILGFKNSGLDSEVSSIQDEHLPHQSPYFTATRVQEPVGLSVITTPVSKAAAQHGPVVPELKLFNELVEAASAKKDKTVNLNGVTFVCRVWNGDTIYCEENTGRAYIDPKDAFTNPDEHSIGYWDAAKECLEQKEVLEEVEEAEPVVEEEQVKEEEQDEQQEQQVEEEEQAEEEAEEEEAMELEEFEYKGKTYYKDAQDQVYQMDDQGELDDTPIGVWNEQKQKVLKYR